jgi:hypothetical protein
VWKSGRLELDLKKLVPVFPKPGAGAGKFEPELIQPEMIACG